MRPKGRMPALLPAFSGNVMSACGGGFAALNLQAAGARPAFTFATIAPRTLVLESLSDRGASY